MLILLDFCRLANCRFPDVVRISRNGRKPRFTLQTVLKTYQKPCKKRLQCKYCAGVLR